MNNLLSLLPSFLGGMLLGIAFLGTLWITVVRGVRTRNPAFWFGLSYILRLALIIAGFYYLSGGQWRPLLACFLGFLLSRALILRMTRPPGLTDFLLNGDPNAAGHET